MWLARMQAWHNIQAQCRYVDTTTRRFKRSWGPNRKLLFGAHVFLPTESINFNISEH